MKKYHCVSESGEHFIIIQNDEGVFFCPVCGSAEFKEPPYDENGNPSFEICSCGFEFGFDDSHLASSEALEGIVVNWDRWRLKFIDKNKHSKATFAKLESNLKKIGYQLAFDLIPMKIDENT